MNISCPVILPAQKRLFSLCVVSLITGALFSGAAQAAVTAAQINTGITTAPTGTPSFNNLPTNILATADACTAGNNSTYTPGNDPCGTDLIIRTNDDVTFQVQYVTSGADTVTIVSTLAVAPSGVSAGLPVADWKTLPPQCTGAGSGISANRQTLTCVLTVSASGTQSILPQATVRGSIANGTSLAVPATTVIAAGGGNINANSDALSTAGPLTVSAAPLYDLDKQTSGAGMQFVKGPDGVTDGWMLSWPLIVRVPYGPKGLESLNATGLTFTDAMSSLVVAGYPTVQAAIRANAVLYNSGTWASPVATIPCGPNAVAPGAFFNRNGGQSRVNGGAGQLTVAQNGTCTATQPGNAAGTDISIALTNVLWANPSPAIAIDGQPTGLLPYGSEVVSDRLAIWVPASVFSSVAGGTIPITNTYTNVQGTSISGQPLKQPTVPDASQGGTANDTATLTSLNFTGSGSFTKYYGDCLSGGCTTLGITTTRAGNGIAVPGQKYVSQLWLTPSGATPLGGGVLCDKIDNTKNIVSENTAGDDAIDYAAYYSVQNLVRNTDYTLEFGTGGLGGVGQTWANRTDFATATCSDDQSPSWYAHIAAVPGGAQMVTKVRVRMLASIPPTRSATFYIRLVETSPSLVAGYDGPAGTVWPAGTKINNWGTFSADSVTSGPSGTVNGINKFWGVPVAATAYNALGATSSVYGDTINQAYASARISKETSVPVNTATQIVAGSTVTYVLKPTLTAATSGLPPASVQVKDVLPPGVSYVAGSASIAPSSVQSSQPAAGYTTLTWDISNVVPNSAISPITFQVITDGTAANGTVVPNLTRATSPADPTPDCSSTGLYAGYTNNGTNGVASGTLCANAARRDLMLSNPPGFKIFKAVNKALIEPGQPITYTLSWLAIGSAPAVMDLIDVLPFVGDGRTPVTAFAGTRTLAPTALAVSGDPTAVMYYVTTAGGSGSADPAASVNGSLGAPSAAWTVCPSNVCPATATAIRMVSSTPMVDGAVRTLSYTINTSGNAAGNVYSNDFTERGAGLANAVLSNTVSTTVALGSIAGKAYLDANNDGVVAASGEPGIGNVRVCLTGYRFGLNGVDDGGAGDDVAITPICQQTLAADGSYLFSGVFAGKYTVTQDRSVANSPGLVSTLDGKDTVGTGAGAVVNGLGAADDAFNGIVLSIGQNVTSYNFGELLPSSLGGTVFVDQNTSGVFDGVDSGIANVLVTLSGVDDLGATVTLYACTGANGTYNFAANGNVQVGGVAPTSCAGLLPVNANFRGLRPGTYAAVEAQPAGYVNATPSSNVGTGVVASSLGVSGTNTVTAIGIGSGQSGVGYNFGEIATVGTIHITKAAMTLPAGTSSISLSFTATCDKPAAGSAYGPVAMTFTGVANSVDIANIPSGAICTVAEVLPSPPAGYAWSAPVVGGLAPSGAMPAGGTQTTTVTNALLSGSLQINKTVSMALPVAATFNFTISCTPPTTTPATTALGAAVTTTQSISMSANGTTGSTGVIGPIAAGSTCSVSEIAPTTMPNYVWGTTPSANVGIAIASGATTAVNFINTLTVQLTDTTSKTVCTPTSGAPGTVVNCTTTCTNNGPAAAFNATCNITNAATLPGNPIPVCANSPTALLAVGSSLTCTVSFALPGSPGNIVVNGGSGATNDSNGSVAPTAGNNPSNALVTPEIPVPTLSILALLLLGTLLAGTVFAHSNKRTAI